MTAPRRFGGAERPDMEPIEFEIAVWHRDHPQDDAEFYTFHAYGMLPGGAIFDLASYTDEQGRTHGQAMLEFFNRAILADELNDWQRVIHDPDNIVLGNDLADVARFLNERYVPPTRQPSRRERRDSRGGRSTTGSTSQDERPALAYS